MHTEIMTDPKCTLAKNHRAGGDGCGAGVSSELTAVSKRRPIAKPLYCQSHAYGPRLSRALSLDSPQRYWPATSPVF